MTTTTTTTDQGTRMNNSPDCPSLQYARLCACRIATIAMEELGKLTPIVNDSLVRTKRSLMRNIQRALLNTPADDLEACLDLIRETHGDAALREVQALLNAPPEALLAPT